MRIKNKDSTRSTQRRRVKEWVKQYAYSYGAIRYKVAQANIPDPGLHLWPPGSFVPAKYIQLLKDAEDEGRSNGDMEESTAGNLTTSQSTDHVSAKESAGEAAISSSQQTIVATTGEGGGEVQVVGGDETSKMVVARAEAQKFSSASHQTQYFTGLLRRHSKRRHGLTIAKETLGVYAPLESINPFCHYLPFKVFVKNVFGLRNFWWKRRIELVKKRNAGLRAQRPDRQVAAAEVEVEADVAIDYDDKTDEDLDKDEEEWDLEMRGEQREQRGMKPSELLVPVDGDICVYCGGTIPYERRDSAPYPFINQCKDCVTAAIPEKRPLTAEFYEQHLERLAEAKGHIHLNNNGWFPPLPNMDDDEEGDAHRVAMDDMPSEETYQRLASKVQQFTPSEERLWKAIVDSQPFDAKQWQATFFPQRTVEAIQAKYWSRGRTLVAGGMCWSVEESNLFFQGLRRFGKHNVWAIQEHIKTRSLAEVVAMIEAMEAEVALLEKVGKGRLRTSEMPMADEVEDDDIRLEERCAEILEEKELKTRWEKMDPRHDVSPDKTSKGDGPGPYELKSADMVAKTQLFNMKTLADLTSRVYVQNERACIERDVVLVMYDALKEFLTPLVKELAALSHERQRTAALRAPSRAQRVRREITRPEITENDVFRLVLSHQLPMGTHKFFDDLPKRLNYYVYPEQVHDPVLTRHGRARVYDLNRDVDMARGKAPDSDNDYDSDEEGTEAANKEWSKRLVSLPPVTPQNLYGGANGDNSLEKTIGVIDGMERTPTGNITRKTKPGAPVYSENATANQRYRQHFGMKRKTDDAWRQTEFAQDVMDQSSRSWQALEDEAEAEGDAWRKRQKWDEGVLHPRLRPYVPFRTSGYSTVHPASVDFSQWRDRVDRMVANAEAVPWYSTTTEDFVDKNENVYSRVLSVNKEFRSHAQVIDSRETRVYTYRPKHHREFRLLRYADHMEKVARVGHRDLNRLYRAGYGLLPESASYLTDPTRSAVPSSTTPVRPGASFGMGFQEPTGLWMRPTTDLPSEDEDTADEEEKEEEGGLIHRKWDDGERVSRGSSPELSAPLENRSGLGTEDSSDSGAESEATSVDGDEEDMAAVEGYGDGDEREAGVLEMLRDDQGYFEVENSEDEDLEERLCEKQILADNLLLVREAVGQRRRELEAETTRQYLHKRFQYFRMLKKATEWNRQYVARRDAWIRKYWDKSDKYVRRMEGVLERARLRRLKRERLAEIRRRDYELRKRATSKFVKKSFLWKLWSRRHREPPEPELDPRFYLRYETMTDAVDFALNRITKTPGRKVWFRYNPLKIQPGQSEELKQKIIERRKKFFVKSTRPERRLAQQREIEQRIQNRHHNASSDSDEFDAALLRPILQDNVLTLGQGNRRI
ncbi:hypothetical protein DFQ26_004062 [Actinomortierella ambigua]|nr:hypothetical protein DFQ26_004062 [Actinomortierella ambigua]